MDWSSSGRYIATLDDYKLRIWDNQNSPDNPNISTKKIVDGVPRTLYYTELMEPTYVSPQNSQTCTIKK